MEADKSQDASEASISTKDDIFPGLMGFGVTHDIGFVPGPVDRYPSTVHPDQADVGGQPTLDET
jgi:hypothetical protein